MRNAQAYVQPRSLDEAVALVRDRPGRAAFLGGGTRLAQNDDPSLETLVDLAALGLDALEATPSGSRIGAMVPLERLRQSPPAALANGVLADALGRTRSIAWRNQATLGGRLREAEPTDLITTALLLLDAVCVVQAAPCVPPATVPVSRLADLPAEALVIAVDLASDLGWRCALESFQETTLAPALVAVGVALRRDAGGHVQAVRVASCGLTPRPARAAQFEAALVGTAPTTLLEAHRHVLEADIQPVDDWRASAAYRTHLGVTLLGRALRRTVELEAPA